MKIVITTESIFEIRGKEVCEGKSGNKYIIIKADDDETADRVEFIDRHVPEDEAELQKKLDTVYKKRRLVRFKCLLSMGRTKAGGSYASLEVLDVLSAE